MMDEKHSVLKWWPLIAAAILAAIAWGSMQTDLNNLKERVKALEDQKTATIFPRVGKGDLCARILDAYDKVSDQQQREQYQEMLTRMDCWSGVPASTNSAGAYDNLKPATGAKDEQNKP